MHNHKSERSSPHQPNPTPPKCSPETKSSPPVPTSESISAPQEPTFSPSLIALTQETEKSQLRHQFPLQDHVMMFKCY